MQLKVKYVNEARLCLGVATIPAIPTDDNTTSNELETTKSKVGVRLKPFVYSGKVILSIKDWNKKVAHEIHRVKNLERNPFWVVSNRPSHSLYLNDNVKHIKDIGKSTMEKLKLADINTVEELMKLDDDGIKIVSKKSLLSIKKIKTIITNATDVVIHNNAPDEVNLLFSRGPVLGEVWSRSTVD
jgi:hypothetical protein